MSERDETVRTEFTIREIVSYILRDRGITLACIFVLLAVVSIDVWLTTPKYRANMVVAPASGGLLESDSKMSPISGFSALLGKGQDITPFDIYLRYYGSLELADMLNRQHNLMKIVFAEQWDEANGSWRPRTGIRSILGDALRWIYRVPGDSRPTMDDLRAYLARAIVITPGDGREMQTVTADDPDPVFARNLILWAHQAAESLTKARTQKSTVANIEYLKQKLATVSQSDQRLALGSLLVSQEGQLMLLQSWNGYASDIVEAPSASVRPVTPNPPLMIVLAVLGGLVVGGLVSIIRMFVGMSPRPNVLPRFLRRPLSRAT